MKKTFYKSLSLIALIAMMANPVMSMQKPKKTGCRKRDHVQNHKDNRKIITQNNKNVPSPHSISVVVMQKANNYRTLNQYVASQAAPQNQGLILGKNRINYKIIPHTKWHMTLIAFSVPFQKQPNPRELREVVINLYKILNNYADDLRGITYEFDQLKTIGKNTHLAAHFNFVHNVPGDQRKNRDSYQRKFTDAYSCIVKEFLQTYPNATMAFGYLSVPHISVASTIPTGQTIAPFSIQPPPAGTVSNVSLMGIQNAPKPLFVSGRYLKGNNPNTGAPIFETFDSWHIK